MVSDISKGDKDLGCERKARVPQIKKTVRDREILDTCICIQKCIGHRSLPTRENIDKSKPKAADGKDIL
jgi:hypothetical protein